MPDIVYAHFLLTVLIRCCVLTWFVFQTKLRIEKKYWACSSQENDISNVFMKEDWSENF